MISVALQAVASPTTSDVHGVGIAVAGLVDAERAEIVAINLMPQLAGLALGSRVSYQAGLPVYIDQHPRTTHYRRADLDFFIAQLDRASPTPRHALLQGMSPRRAPSVHPPITHLATPTGYESAAGHSSNPANHRSVFGNFHIDCPDISGSASNWLSCTPDSTRLSAARRSESLSLTVITST